MENSCPQMTSMAFRLFHHDAIIVNFKHELQTYFDIDCQKTIFIALDRMLLLVTTEVNFFPFKLLAT